MAYLDNLFLFANSPVKLLENLKYTQAFLEKPRLVGEHPKPHSAKNILGVRTRLSSTKSVSTQGEDTKNPRGDESIAGQPTILNKKNNINIRITNLGNPGSTMSGFTYSAPTDVHLKSMGPQTIILRHKCFDTNTGKKVPVVVEEIRKC